VDLAFINGGAYKRIKSLVNHYILLAVKSATHEICNSEVISACTSPWEAC
jgi:hypothetical protein